MQLAGIATGTYDDGKEAPGGLCLNTLDTEIQTAYEMKCELGREGILRSNNLDVNSPSAGGEPRAGTSNLLVLFDFCATAS